MSAQARRAVSGCSAATSATGDLRQKLKGALTRAKIREVQREISVDDSDQGHVREVQAFRDHLGADEKVDLARAKGA